jgi:selenocysteine lyase/cysteine desulfurase
MLDLPHLGSRRPRGPVMTAQSKYLRLAPHFYLTDEEILEAAEILNALAGE